MQRWKTVDPAGLAEAMRELRREIGERPVMFVCIGTDRSTGDAFGPLVGTGLVNAGFRRVVGTLAAPCDAHTLPSRIAEISAAAREGRAVIAVDAALGRAESVGKFQVTAVPTLPGLSTGKTLPPVGDYGIAGIVNSVDQKQKSYMILQNTPLYRVMTMAEQLVAAVAAAFPRRDGGGT